MLFSEVEEIDYRSAGQLPQEGSFPPFDRIDPKSKQFIRTLSAIFSSTLMLPIDRIAAKKTVGQSITPQVVLEVAKSPLKGGIPRLTNSFMGSFITFGGSAALEPAFDQLFPASPRLASALSLAGGATLDRVITAPLATVVLRMQTQDKTFFAALTEITASQNPRKMFYAGTPALVTRDVLYLPICILLAEHLRNFSLINRPSPLLELFTSTLAFTIGGTVAVSLCYPLQYIGVVQKDFPTSITAEQVAKKTLSENGVLGFYRGYKLATVRIALFNSFFGGGIVLGERLVKWIYP